jgi:tetraacyldisaccharide 4'-kinase
MSERRLGNAAHAWVRRWWRGEGGAVGGVLDGVLWPVEHLFGAIAAARNNAYERGLLRVERATIPVISVGNLSVGGAGKTPVAAWVAGRLLAWGFRPAIVLRGYAEDEVDVHRELNPEVEVVVGKRRAAAVAEAAVRGCDVAVVDDGFQHRALARDLDLVLVSADGWRERRPLLPRGPWRERVTGLRRAGVAVVTRKAVSLSRAEEVAAALDRAVPGTTVAICRIEPSRVVSLHGGVPNPVENLSGREVLAVASLADPEPFRRNLQAAGARVELLAYPDHHDFDRSDVDRILRDLRGRPLLMTRKDAVKLRALIPEGPEALVLEQTVHMECGGDLLDDALRKAVRL